MGFPFLSSLPSGVLCLSLVSLILSLLIGRLADFTNLASTAMPSLMVSPCDSNWRSISEVIWSLYPVKLHSKFRKEYLTGWLFWKAFPWSGRMLSDQGKDGWMRVRETFWKTGDRSPGEIVWGLMYYTYVLQSEKDGNLYVGFTKDLKQRLELHNKGRVDSTKDRCPLKLIYYEACTDRDDATKREKHL